MINKDLRRQPLQYLAPGDIDPDNYIACNTHELFLISTHFTRIPKESDPEWDEVYYFIQRDALSDKKIWEKINKGTGVNF